MRSHGFVLSRKKSIGKSIFNLEQMAVLTKICLNRTCSKADISLSRTLPWPRPFIFIAYVLVDAFERHKLYAENQHVFLTIMFLVARLKIGDLCFWVRWLVGWLVGCWLVGHTKLKKCPTSFFYKNLFFSFIRKKNRKKKFWILLVMEIWHLITINCQ